MIKQLNIYIWSIWTVVIIAGLYLIYTNMNQADNFHTASNSNNEFIATNLYSKVVNSIYVIYGKNNKNKIITSDSAVAITTKYLVTNCHVVLNTDHFTVSDGFHEKNAELYSQHGDLCIVTVSGMKFQPIGIRRERDVKIGGKVYVFHQRIDKSISEGVISNKNYRKDITLIQVNASTPKGLKGEYLIDGNGKLIGIETHTDNYHNTNSSKFVSSIEWIEDRLFKPDANEKQTTKPQSQTAGQDDVSIQHDKITCPTIDRIQQASQQINDAFLYDGTYRITTSASVFQESNLFWIVGVNDIVAGSSDEAIGIAQAIASKTNHKKNEYAEVMTGPINFYVCNYGSGDVGAIGFNTVNHPSLRGLIR